MSRVKFSIKIVVSIFLFCCVSSCSKDEFYHIRTLIEGNTDEPIRCYGVYGTGDRCLIIRKRYEYEFKRERGHYDFGIQLRCDDPNTLITVTYWVDGKKKTQRSANRYLDVRVKV